MTHSAGEPNGIDSTLWVTATLISELISEASSDEFARCLCEQVRELTGARTVILLKHEPTSEACRALYVCPPRRGDLFSQAEWGRFCPSCTPATPPILMADLLPEHPFYAQLSEKKVASFLRFPLAVGGQINGSLLLLDLPEPNRTDDICRMMDLLGPFFGVALQNALTQQKIRAQNETLEKQVKARTAQLAITQFTVDNSMDAVFWMNHAGRFIYSNKEAAQSLGYSQSELQQLSVTDIDLDFQGEAWAQYWERRKTDGTQSFESRHKTKGGRIFPVEIHVSYLQFGDTEYACAFAHDITERKKADRMFKTFFEQPMNLNLIASFEGIIVHVNTAWTTILGYTPDELEGTSFFDLVHPDDLAATNTDLEKVKKGNQTLYFENRYRHKNGSYRTLAWTSMPSIEDQQGYAVAIDITERKRAETTMIEQLEELTRWQGALMGRENRVMEMKQEVNALLIRLDEPPRYASVMETGPEE